MTFNMSVLVLCFLAVWITGQARVLFDAYGELGRKFDHHWLRSPKNWKHYLELHFDEEDWTHNRMFQWKKGPNLNNLHPKILPEQYIWPKTEFYIRSFNKIATSSAPGLKLYTDDTAANDLLTETPALGDNSMSFSEGTSESISTVSDSSSIGQFSHSESSIQSGKSQRPTDSTMPSQFPNKTTKPINAFGREREDLHNETKKSLKETSALYSTAESSTDESNKIVLNTSSAKDETSESASFASTTIYKRSKMPSSTSFVDETKEIASITSSTRDEKSETSSSSSFAGYDTSEIISSKTSVGYETSGITTSNTDHEKYKMSGITSNADHEKYETSGTTSNTDHEKYETNGLTSRESFEKYETSAITSSTSLEINSETIQKNESTSISYFSKEDTTQSTNNHERDYSTTESLEETSNTVFSKEVVSTTFVFPESPSSKNEIVIEVVPQDHVIKIPSIRAARQILSIVFITIALTAMVVMAIYMFRVKRRAVQYDQLVLLP